MQGNWQYLVHVIVQRQSGHVFDVFSFFNAP